MSDKEPKSPDGVKPPQLNWEYKKDLGINTKMREVIQATLKACEAERDRLKQKLEKLHYGG